MAKKPRLDSNRVPWAEPRSEGEFQLNVIELAHLCGWKVAHFKAAMMPDGRWLTPVQADGKGFPDLLMVRDGVLVWAELKIDASSDLRDEQMDWLFALGIATKHVYRWTPGDWNEIDQVLRSAK